MSTSSSGRPKRPMTGRPAGSSKRVAGQSRNERSDRPDRNDRGDRTERGAGRRDWDGNNRSDRSSGGERPSYGDRRPSYGDRDRTGGGERPSYGERRPSYGERPSYGDRDRGGSAGGRDDRGGFQRRDDRTGGGERGGFQRREERAPAAAPEREYTSHLELPDDIDLNDLDEDIRAELRTLVRMKAQLVGGHLVMAGRLIDEDPEKAYEYARSAQQLAPRLAATREALGLAAYLSDRYAEALAELRAARRMTGSNHQWAVMADCERGLGRPEKALEMAQAPEAKELDKGTQIELRIVAAGARRDLGQVDAAVAMLQGADLTPAQVEPWTARLRYAYADALLEAEREPEAREWFARAAEADSEGVTDAEDRIAELDGVVFGEDEQAASAASDTAELVDDDEDEDEDDDEFDDEDDEDDDEYEDDDLDDEDDEDDDEDTDVKGGAPQLDAAELAAGIEDEEQ